MDFKAVMFKDQEVIEDYLGIGSNFRFPSLRQGNGVKEDVETFPDYSKVYSYTKSKMNK